MFQNLELNLPVSRASGLSSHSYWCSCLVFADSYNVIYSFSWTIIFFTNSLQPMMDNLFSCTLVQGGKAGGRAKTWCMLFFKNYFLRIIRFKYENRVRPSEGFWAPTPPQKWTYQIQPFGATVWGPTQLLGAARPSPKLGHHHPLIIHTIHTWIGKVSPQSFPLGFTMGWQSLGCVSCPQG